MPRTAAILAVSVAFIGLAAGGYFLLSAEGRDRFAQCRGGIVTSGGGDIGGPFSLISETGERVTEQEVIDRLSLVYFGYSFCPDVCPVDLFRNGEAVYALAERGVDVKPVFITLDPERDTVEQLAEYTDLMHPDMVGLTGPRVDIDAAIAQYRVYSVKSGDDPEDYLMDHSSFTYLMDPEEGFLDFFPRTTTPQDMAERVACYAAAL